MTAAEGSKTWKVEKVAVFLELSESKVYKMAKKGLIPCHRVGRSLRFHPDEIVQWFAGLKG
jgi:excisionase family DNA binding protein